MPSPRRNRAVGAVAVAEEEPPARTVLAFHENRPYPHVGMQPQVIKTEFMNADEDFGMPHPNTTTPGFAAGHAMEASCSGEQGHFTWSAPLMFTFPPPPRTAESFQHQDATTCSLEVSSSTSCVNGNALAPTGTLASLDPAHGFGDVTGTNTTGIANNNNNSSNNSIVQDPSCHAIEMFSAWFPAPPTEDQESIVDLSLFDIFAAPNGPLGTHSFHFENPCPFSVPAIMDHDESSDQATSASGQASIPMPLHCPPDQHNLYVSTTALLPNEPEFIQQPHAMWTQQYPQQLFVDPPLHHSDATFGNENGPCNSNQLSPQHTEAMPVNMCHTTVSDCKSASTSSQSWPTRAYSSSFYSPVSSSSSSTKGNVSSPSESDSTVFAFGSHRTTGSSCRPSLPTTCSSSLAQAPEVQLCFLTTLNDCYWKNGRKNLQCFPLCPEHHDFYSMKINNRKHSSAGVCRGPVHCQMVRRVTPSCSTLTNEAIEFQGPAFHSLRSTASSGRGCFSKDEYFVLGRFERVYQNEKLMNQCTDHPHHHERDRLAPHAGDQFGQLPNFTSFSDFDAFRQSCFQAVEMLDERHIQGEMEFSTWFFLPDVWKVQPMLKKKRKATRSMPARTYPFCFRVFAYQRVVCPSPPPPPPPPPPLPIASSSQQDRSTRVHHHQVDTVGTPGALSVVGGNGNGGHPERDGYHFHCVASCNSTYFELYSTRTVDRVKLKVHSAREAMPSSSSSAAAAVRRA